MEFRPILSAMWRNKTGSVLIALQIALTLVIVVNSMFMAQNRLEHINRPSGMDIENIITASSLGFGNDYDQDATIDKDLELLRALPGRLPCGPCRESGKALLGASLAPRGRTSPRLRAARRFFLSPECSRPHRAQGPVGS